MRSTEKSQDINIRFVSLVSLVAAVGGLLFGYDTAVISGAIGFMQVRFSLNAVMTGWSVSSLIIGCMVGAAFAGVLSDRFGRKKMLILSAILFSIGSVGSAIPNTISGFVAARIIGGLGVGIASTLSPLYIAEIAPAQYRGRLVSMNQLAIVTGIFAIFFVDAGVASYGNTAWDISTGWRFMFGLGIVPGVLFLVLLLFVPESPRWLEKQGEEKQALAILQRINGVQQAEVVVADIKKSIASEGGSIKQLFRPGLRLTLVIGVVLAVLQQVTGINAIMYYAPEIFKQTGAGTNASLIETVMVGIVNLAFTLVALWLIDKVGRKALLLAGSAVMGVCLLMVGLAFHTGHTAGPWVLVFILLFVASFAVSMGPVVWVIISEIFPTRIRGRATAVASVALWAADYLVSQTFPVLLASVGPATTFWVFAIMSVVAFIFTLQVVPETKEKSLEQIEQLWMKKSVDNH